MSSTTGYTAPSGAAHGVDVPRRRYTEAKDGFKTSEFYGLFDIERGSGGRDTDPA